MEDVLEAANLPQCSCCHSTNQKPFNAEIALHFPGLKGLDKPIVWVFPKVLVCLNCGGTLFTVPENELKVLQTGLPVEGAVISTLKNENHNHN
jgi:hypothetical protein